MPPNHAEPATTPQLPSPSARPIVYDSSGEGRDAMPRTEARREPFSRSEKMLFALATILVALGGMQMTANARTEDRLRDMQEQIGSLRTEMHQEIGSLRTEMHQEIGALRAEMHQEIGKLRAEMYREFGTLREEIRALSERIARIETLLGDQLPPGEPPAEP